MFRKTLEESCVHQYIVWNVLKFNGKLKNFMIFVSILMTSQENYMEAKGEVKAKGKMTEEAGNNENKL